jgi:hypothetical protein
LNKYQQNFLFENILEVVRNLPAWVLQALFAEISGLLTEKAKYINQEKMDRTEMLQLLVPELSDFGFLAVQRNTKTNMSSNISPAVLKFLQAASERKNFIDICLINNWTIDQTTRILLECLKRNFIKYNFPHSLYNQILFIAGELRIGEFLIRKNKISTDQLEHALKLQSDLSNTFGERRKIVEILVNMGKINREEVLDYLTVKDMAKTHIEIPPVRTSQSVQLERLVQELRENNEDLIKKYNRLNDELKKVTNKAKELEDQLELQLERNNMLHTKIVAYEKKLAFFKKI